MSILLIEVVPQGIIFGADRNITRMGSREDQSVEYLGQYQRTKVLRWPKRKALAGYVGAGQIGGEPTDEWLYEFIGDNRDFTSIATLAESLRSQVERQRSLDEGDSKARLLIIMLAGFEKRNDVWVPIIREVANYHKLHTHIYDNVTKKFRIGDEVPFSKENLSDVALRECLREAASRYAPFWIHQGQDLGTFNLLEAFLKDAFKLLCKTHPDHTLPQNLSDWERQVRMSILTYAAYFQAYRETNEQLVGGGVDTICIPWPE